MAYKNPPQLCLITGDGAPIKGSLETWGYYTHDLGFDFICLLQTQQWNPDQSPYLNDMVRTNIDVDGKKIWVSVSNVSQRDDYVAERQSSYAQAFCVVMIYSALSMRSLEDIKRKIDEAKRMSSDMGREPPPFAIIGTRYHRKPEEIEVPFEIAQEYAASIGVKIYQTYGAEKAKEALEVMRSIIRPFLENGLLLADKDLDASLKHAADVFYQRNPKVAKRSRCSIQ